LANVWFGFPSRKLIVIGVTGTDGKTTTASLIYHILHTAGYNASMISSVGAVIGGKPYDVGFHVTTPSPWALQRFISLCHPELVSGSKSPRAEMPKQVRHDNKDHYLVLETTSHAIDQNRIWGIPFDIGVLTNVTHEHLDYHKTYENYVKTKAKLLKMARVAVVNRDDISYELISNIKNQISNTHSKNKKWVTYGLRDDSDVNPQKFPFKSTLIGEFNKYNVLAAVAVCRSLGVDDKTIRNAITSFDPPIGREEIVYENDFTVMVDFAHTPNAYDAILSSIKSNIKFRLIHMFGVAGERDASKRPLMGKASAKYSDIIILTAEDPRSESVEKIMNEIESGIKIPNSKFQIPNKSKIQIFKIPNRQEAITAAIKMARRGDFVLITGKSHEKSMNYGKGEEPWDEFGAVSRALSVRRDDK